MNAKKIVLASALLALAMVFSTMALPAMVGRAAPAATPAAEVDLTAEPTAEYVTDPYTFTMVTISEPDYLDPAIDYETAGNEVIQNVYETLIWYDECSVIDLVPMLATEVPTIDNGGISEDGMNYTFHIREGVTFHDGTALTAEDVAYSIQRVLRIHDPSGPSWMIEQVMTNYLSFYIDGMTTVGDWAMYENVPQWLLDGAGLNEAAVLDEAANQAVAEFMVTEEGAMTVNFRLTKPYPAFIKICAYSVMSIVSKDWVEDNGGIVNGEHNEVMIELPCGTGPYLLPEGGWERGVQVHLERNTDYWGAAPSLDDVYIQVVVDEMTRISMLENGTADCATLSIASEDLFSGDPDYMIVKGLPTFDMTFAGFNMDIDEVESAYFGGDVPADFFADANIRSAFVRMFDYDTFLENVLKGNAIQPNGPIPKGLFGYDETVPTYDFNLEDAKAYLMLAENPYVPGSSYWDTGFSIALFYNAGNIYRETFCMYMSEALDDLTDMAAGDTDAVFDGVVNTLDWPTYLALLRSSPSPFPVFFLGWAPDYADPDNYVTPFLHSVYGTFTHSTGYANATLDDMITDAAVELDDVLRADMYSDISMGVYQDAPYLWLWQGNNFHIERSWVNGYYFNPMYSGLYYAALSKDVIPIPIDAAIEATPSVGVVGYTVTFNGSASYSADGNIISYVWDFDDGTGEDTGIIVDHIFDAAGTYNVSLTVTDDLDNTDTEVIQYLVEEPPANEAPTAVASATPTSADVDEVVTLDGSDSYDDGTIVDYEWVITEGATEIVTLSGETVTYAFDAEGSYRATLNVTDDGGLWDTDFVIITVTEPVGPNEPPVADAGADQSVEVGETVTFDGEESSDDVEVTNYTWTFEYDEEPVELYGIWPTFTFDIVDVYVVTLNVTDEEGLWDTDTVTITVTEPAPPENEPPVADAGADQTVDVGETVTFDGAGSSDDVGVTNYTWTFDYEGVAVELYGVSPTYEFATAGTWTVALTVTDADGETDTDTVVITVEAVEPPPDDDKSFIEEYALAIVAIVIVLVVVGIILMLVMRKKKAV